MTFHAAVLLTFALNLAFLGSEDRVWLLSAIPVLAMSSFRLWQLRKPKKLTPAERLRQLRGPEFPSDDGYSNDGSSSVTAAAGWNHGFFS
jgi:hypothetical protein